MQKTLPAFSPEPDVRISGGFPQTTALVVISDTEPSMANVLIGEGSSRLEVNLSFPPEAEIPWDRMVLVIPSPDRLICNVSAPAGKMFASCWLPGSDADFLWMPEIQPGQLEEPAELVLVELQLGTSVVFRTRANSTLVLSHRQQGVILPFAEGYRSPVCGETPALTGSFEGEDETMCAS